MEDFRVRLGALCSELSRWTSLGDIIRQSGAGQELDDLRTLAAGQGVGPGNGRVLLDAIEEACKRAGLDSVTRTTGFLRLPAGTALSSAVDSWVCPHGSCDRVVLPEEARDAPDCPIAGGISLRSFRVSP